MPAKVTAPSVPPYMKLGQAPVFIQSINFESHPMTDTNDTINTDTTIAVPEIDPIQPIFEGQCESLSGRSTLTFHIGRHTDPDQTGLHLRIHDNSGGGMFCRDWAAASQLDEVLQGDAKLTAKTFQCIHPGRSINTGGFLLATLKHLGLIRPQEVNTRLHEHVPTTTFERAALEAIEVSEQSKKAKPAKPKQKGG